MSRTKLDPSKSPSKNSSFGSARDARTTKARRGSLTAVATLTAAALLVAPSAARADEVSPTAKGIVGGALLGGEIVTFGEAIFNVHSPAAYIVGAGAGAAAGGVGGYFIEQSVDDGRVPAYMLAGGLVLLIPAIVVALDQTRYLPDQGAREDKPVVTPPADPGKPGGSAVIGAEASPSTAPATQPASSTPATTPSGGTSGGTQGPQSLLNVREGGFYMGVPLPEIRQAFTTSQAQKLAVQNNVSEVRLPVVDVKF